MNNGITREDVREVYAALRDAKLQAAIDAQIEVEAKQELDIAKANGVLSGTIAGKNETEREANARIVCAAEIEALRIAATAARNSRFQLDMAQTAVEELRLLVRLDEMEAFAGKAQPPSREG